MYGRTLTLLTAVAMGGPAASAATYIVDNQNPHAADTNSGTRRAPLRTIGAAAKLVKPGDTVSVQPGIYRESVTLTVSGLPGRPITFQSARPHAAVVDGADIVTHFQPVSPGVQAFDAPDLHKSNNEYTPGEQVYVNGEPLERAADAAHVTPGSFWLDVDAKRVLLSLLEDQMMGRVRVEYAHRDGQFAPDGWLGDIRIRGFTIVHNASPFGSRFGILVKGRRWLVEDNHVRWSSYAGIRMEDSSGCVVRSNLVEWSGATGLGGYGNINLLFENNRVLHNNWRRQDPNFDGGSGKWVYTYDSIIRGNEFGFSHGYGPWLDIACGGNTFERNVCHDHTIAAGPFSEISWGTMFLGNTVYNSAVGILIGESSNCEVRGNVLVNNRSGGVHVRTDYGRKTVNEYGQNPAAGFRAQLARDVPDITPARLDSLTREYEAFWVKTPAFAARNNLISGNLFLNNQTAYYEWRNYAEPSPLDKVLNATGDNNLFGGTAPDGLFRSHTGSYGGLKAWQKASGRDLHSRMVGPDDGFKGLHIPAGVMRPWSDIDARGLTLVNSPSSAELVGRLLRSPKLLERVDVGDPQVQAYALEVEGRRTLAVWTGQVADRRPLRLNVNSRRVIVEDGYLQKTSRAPARGIVDITAGFLPTYVRGVGARIIPTPAVRLTVRGFNLPGQPVPVTATFVNDTMAPFALEAEFQPGPGYAPSPSHLARTLQPGQTYEATVTLVPDGAAPHGPAFVRLSARLGGETITRSAAFAVGEGSGTIPFATALPWRDAGAAAWRRLGDAALVGAIGSADQFASGDKAAWTGPGDLSGRVYAAWTKGALLVGVDVLDDSVVPAPSGGDPWNSDAVEVFVDGRAPAFQYQKEPSEGVYQIGVSPGAAGKPPMVKVLSRSPLEGLETTARLMPGGYYVVVRIPLSARNFPAGEIVAGRPFKLSVLLDDKDAPKAQGRENVFGWSFSPSGGNFADTSGWKTLTLGP